jgi:hypothetical protein
MASLAIITFGYLYITEFNNISTILLIYDFNRILSLDYLSKLPVEFGGSNASATDGTKMVMSRA